VGSLLLPRFYSLRPHGPLLLTAILILVALGALLEAGLFVAVRTPEDHRIGALLLIPYAMLMSAVLMWTLPWKPWRQVRDAMGRSDRMAKFVRASLIWLVVHMAMTAALPFWSMLMGVEFSHAFHGATRQAFVVGFATNLIMGFGARVVPNLNNILPIGLPSLRWTFALVNVGLLLHMAGMIGTDLLPRTVWVLPVAGLMQYAGLTMWSVHLLRCIVTGWRTSRTAKPKQSAGVALPVMG
jgi:hypothetical protein